MNLICDRFAWKRQMPTDRSRFHAALNGTMHAAPHHPSGEQGCVRGKKREGERNPLPQKNDGLKIGF